ncbi:putative phosphatidate phosphatase isoform X1 [Daphnia pulicaria]|uniref:putative phosphatidate phosphatase isoform X1 n=1 Tax=Daphnia pulicaria TaxID=35523 RepID=UPI001EEC0B1F|nr:putative phosphatidate phosphatase isoform X1 [Daphnia pulicaria]
MTSAALIRQLVIDAICLAIVWLPVLLLDLIGKPFERGFYCDDTSIRYPYKDSTVTSAVLYSYSLGLPIAMIITVEIFRWKHNLKSENVSRQNICSTINISSSIRIPSVIAEIIHLVVIFLFGAACSQVATDFGKYTVGRLRPHFIDMCKPENLSELCPLGGPPVYITDFKCTGTNEQRIKDSRLSFPSGHASFSAYAMLFLALYLQRRMNWTGSKLFRSTIQITALMLTWYTGLSRITDYKHHWSDVLAGFFIGFTAASLTALYVSSLFRPSSNSNIALPTLLSDSKIDRERRIPH